jgi:hypothetical protein
MAVRFDVSETMAGTHHFVDASREPGKDREAYFRIRWGGGLASFLTSRVKHADCEGIIFIGGLTDSEVPCTGTLSLDYFGDHKITYELDFDVAGARHHLHAEKTGVLLHRPLELAKTHTTAYGILTDSRGTIISRSVLHFDPQDLARFAGSVRVRTS